MIEAKKAKEMTKAYSCTQMLKIETGVKEEASRGKSYFILNESFESGVQSVLQTLGYHTEYIRVQSYKIKW